jgi:hypothetical protein
MKTRIARTLSLVAVVFTMCAAHAAGPFTRNDGPSKDRNVVVKSALERSLDRTLNRNLAYPVMAKENMLGQVDLSLVIDAEGRIEILSCSSDNEHLKEYVVRKLSGVDIGENPDGIWKTTHLHITFRPEKG